MLARMSFDIADLDRFRPSGTHGYIFFISIRRHYGKKKPKLQERLYNMSTARFKKNKLQTRESSGS
jgi:hypothetical protein